MIDLIAITTGVLLFLGWSAAMFVMGIVGQRRRERERRRREEKGREIVKRLMAQRAPDKVEPAPASAPEPTETFATGGVIGRPQPPVMRHEEALQKLIPSAEVRKKSQA